jgi:tetratricopeptide (TPR) repeat protein
LLALIVDRAEGNPFFAEQILRYLQESDLLVVGPDGWQVESEQRKPLPADVSSVLIARLDRLAQAVKEVVQTAAVLGREFEVLILAGMLSDKNTIDERIEAAEQAAVWSPLNQMRYLFRHALLRDTAYRMQVRARRQALHRLAAKAIETLHSDDLRPHYAELAYHYERAALDAEAAEWYMLAAEQAKSRGTLLDARTYLDRTLALIPSEQTSRRWQALVRQIEVLTLLGDADASLKEVSAALELARQTNDDALIADACYQRGTIAQMMGNDQEAMADLDAGLEASKRSGDRHIETLIQGMMTITLARMGWIEDAAIVAESALALAEELGKEDILVRTLNNLANFNMFAGDFGRAAELLTRQVDINRRQGDRVGEAHGLTNLAYNLLSVGLYEEAQAAIVQALQLTVSMGARRLSVYNRLNLSLAQTRLGRPVDARQEIETTHKVLASFQDNFALAISYSYLGLAQESGGQAEQAAVAYEAAIEMLTEMSAAGYAVDAMAGRCRCALLQDDIPTARRLASEVWEYLRQSGVSGLEFPLMAIESCARAFESAGDEDAFQATVVAGYLELMERAEKISDGEWRSAFLHNVPEHQAVRQRWERLEK